MATFEPVDTKKLTEEDKCKAVASLKHDGSIKAQAFANGHKQQEYAENTETELPMAMMESIFITAAIDAEY